MMAMKHECRPEKMENETKPLGNTLEDANRETYLKKNGFHRESAVLDKDCP